MELPLSIHILARYAASLGWERNRKAIAGDVLRNFAAQIEIVALYENIDIDAV